VAIGPVAGDGDVGSGCRSRAAGGDEAAVVLDGHSGRDVEAPADVGRDRAALSETGVGGAVGTEPGKREIVEADTALADLDAKTVVVR
jgi:hypothetical protein